MLSSYDPASQCRRHPLQRVRGVCAMCLKERLSKIACSRAASTPARLIATNVRCSCSSLEPAGAVASAPLNSVYHHEPEYVPKVQSNGERTIASLIERDILEAPERSCCTGASGELAPEFCGEDYRTLLQLQRSRSFSLGSNSTSSSLLLISNRDSSSWESIRSSKRSSTELSTHYHQRDNVMPAPTASSDHGRQIIRSDMKTISKADIPSKHLQEEKQHVKSMGSEEQESRPQSRGFEEDGGLSSILSKRSALVSPALCDLKQASLTKSKSTGWVLNYADINWSKASPSFCGLLDDNSAKSKNVKAQPLFSRSRSTSTRTAAASSSVNVSTADTPAAKRKSCSDIHPPPYSKHNYGRRLRNFIFQLRGLINTGRAATALAKDDHVLSHFQPIMEWKEEDLGEEASSSVQLYDSRVEELAASAEAVSNQSRKSNCSRSARTRTSSSSPSLSSSFSQSSSSPSSSSDTPTNKKPSIASLISMDSQQLTQVLSVPGGKGQGIKERQQAPSTTSSSS